MADWDAEQYLRFAEERTRPARELLARVSLDKSTHVADFGCGTGNSTGLLFDRFPEAQVTGIDNSQAMLARAKQDHPRGNWVCADAATYDPPEPLDLLFANAVFQWLPDHQSLFPRLLHHLRPGGVLAVQMPQNHEEPSHWLIRETPPAIGARWEERSSTLRSAAPVGHVAYYYDLLAPIATRLDLWQTTYHHVLPNVGAIVEWVKGTALRPYLEALREGERADFLARYTRALDTAYPQRAGGGRLFAFRRLFIVATR